MYEQSPMCASSASFPGYDLIGDVHGCGATLVHLLNLLGYRLTEGCYRHPEGRKVIFVGDIIDRGPRIREALNLVRAMVDSGEAEIVMGNHEYNMLAFSTPGRPGSGRDHLRAHTERHSRIVRETLEQFAGHADEWADHLRWFQQIPLALEKDGLRVVHACWDPQLMPRFLARYPDARIDADFLHASVEPGSFEFHVMDRCTRGCHMPLPPGVRIHSGDGFTRNSFRVHFWAENPQTYGDVVFQPDNLPGDLEDQPISDEDREALCFYGPDEPHLFVGHYWCEGFPAVVRPNITCVDYSAVKFGRLVAYRYDGEATLSAKRFVWVDVQGEERPPIDELAAEGDSAP
ncbi:metallophosphoesterase [Terasakiispira papahanaumokuakeensis]|nr:metallophosphoesterase [Terasakiispira papahanaumokuakeensis]